MLSSLWSQTSWNHEELKGSRNFTDIMGFVFAGNKEPELFSIVIWNLGNHHNNLRLGKTALPLNKITEHARERQLEALAPSANHSLHRGQHQMAWSPPEAQRCKKNYDTASFVEDNKAGLGIVIRNSDGHTLVSLTQQIPLPATVIEIEALAARRAMELALELSLDNIVMEGDNESLFKALKSRDRSLAQHDHLIKDILFLSSFFSTFNVSWVPRQCNKLAHSLAHKAKVLPFMTVWMGNVPPDLVSVLQVDLSCLS